MSTPMTVANAAESGSWRDLLVSLRDRIARNIDSPDIRDADLASLSRRLMDIAKEVEALGAEGKGDEVGSAAATGDEAWPAP